MIQVQIIISGQQLVIHAGSLAYEKDRIVISEIQNPQQKQPAKVTQPVIEKNAGKKISALQGKPAATGNKKCPVCQKDYKPRSNGQKYCDTCRLDKIVSGKNIVISQDELLDPMGLKKV